MSFRTSPISSALGDGVALLGALLGAVTIVRAVPWLLPFTALSLALFLGLRYRRHRIDARFQALYAERVTHFEAAEVTAALTGRPCVSCSARIVFADDGIRCGRCGSAMHRGCAARHELVEHGRRERVYR